MERSIQGPMFLLRHELISLDADAAVKNYKLFIQGADSVHHTQVQVRARPAAIRYHNVSPAFGDGQEAEGPERRASSIQRKVVTQTVATLLHSQP